MPLKSGDSKKSALRPFRYTPGVSYWPEYLWGSSEPVAQDVEIEMGNIYTKNADGRIIATVAVSNVAQLQRGIFQASRSWTNTKFPEGEKAASADTATSTPRRMVFWGLDSFVVLKAAANVIPGQIVDLDATGTATTADQVKPNTTGTRNAGSLGVCQDILKPAKSTQAGDSTDDRTRPDKTGTAAGDLVCVRLGVR